MSSKPGRARKLFLFTQVFGLPYSHHLFLQNAVHSSFSIASLQHEPKRAERYHFNTNLSRT